MEEIKVKQQDANTKQMLAQAKIAETQANIAKDGQGQQGVPLDPNKLIDAQLKQAELKQKDADLQMKKMDIMSDMRTEMMNDKENQLDNWNRRKDRESAERIAAVKLAQDVMKTPNGLQIMKKVIDPNMMKVLESKEDEPPFEGQ